MVNCVFPATPEKSSIPKQTFVSALLGSAGTVMVVQMCPNVPMDVNGTYTPTHVNALWEQHGTEHSVSG